VQSRHRIRVGLTVALLGLLASAAPAAADDPTPPPWLKVENGQTQPQFDFTQAVEETVFVETELDSDRDGRRDRVRIRISRPRETETLGYKVPVVFEHSPYRGDFGPIENHPVDFDRLPQESLFGGDRAGAAAARAAGSRRVGAKAARARARARARMLARADLPGQHSTSTTSRVAMRSCWARASAPSTRTAARPSATGWRRSAPRP
jgi:hypothetical protein